VNASAASTTTESAHQSRALRRYRPLLLGAAAVRAVLGIVAIPLVPVLYEDHFAWVVLLRPTKEVLLAAGFLIRQGDMSLLTVVAASLPLMVGGVWIMYALGVAYRDELRNADLPGIAGRLLPPDRIERLSRALERDGMRLVFLGRLAIFPSTLMAAAAGASDVSPRRFVVADGLGAVVSLVGVLLAGYLLGETYERAGPWLTLAGAAALLVLLFLFGRRLKRESDADSSGGNEDS
jgi:membrane protein DedA with SNARE-associated domain